MESITICVIILSIITIAIILFAYLGNSDKSASGNKTNRNYNNIQCKHPPCKIVGVRFSNQNHGCYYYLTQSYHGIGEQVYVSTNQGIKKVTVVFYKSYNQNEPLPYNYSSLKSISESHNSSYNNKSTYSGSSYKKYNSDEYDYTDYNPESYDYNDDDTYDEDNDGDELNENFDELENDNRHWDSDNSYDYDYNEKYADDD